jgi:hypothetical protein
VRVAKRRGPHNAESWRDPAVGRRFTIASIGSIAVGVVAPAWLGLFVPVGLVLAVVAWFKGDKLGLWFVVALFFVLRLAMTLLALQKYG